MVSVSAAERETILRIFPIIRQIKDEDLREKVIRVWVRAWQESGVSDLDQVANEREGPQFTVVKHNRVTTAAALAMGREMEQEYGISVNYDYLIAAGILHDVDKPVTFKMEAGKMVPTKVGRMIPHGPYGMHLALAEGLPLEVANLCFAHSGASTENPNTMEGVLIHFADKGCARSLRVAHGEFLPPK